MNNKFLRNTLALVVALTGLSITPSAMAQTTPPPAQFNFDLSGGSAFASQFNTAPGGTRMSFGNSLTTLLANTCGDCSDNVANTFANAGGEATHAGTGTSLSEGLVQVAGEVQNAGFFRNFTGTAIGGGISEGDTVDTFFRGNLSGNATLTSCDGQSVCDAGNGVNGDLTSGAFASSTSTDGLSLATGSTSLVIQATVLDGLLSAPPAP